MVAMNRRTVAFLGLCGVAGIGVLAACWGLWAADPQPAGNKSAGNKSAVVGFEAAKSTQADWGEMRRYFTGETVGTRNLLTAVAVIKPGKAVHRAHRHAEEEYLILTEGSGTWSLDGKEFPAKRGDILYAEPWVFHGITNTGAQPLSFAVVRFNSKGIALPPRPDDRKDEQ